MKLFDKFTQWNFDSLSENETEGYHEKSKKELLVLQDSFELGAS